MLSTTLSSLLLSTSILLARPILASTNSSSNSVITNSRYGTVTGNQTGAVLDVTLYNNSTDINVWDNRVSSDVLDLVVALQNDSSVKVVTFRSGNPDFFFAHLELMNRTDQPVFPTTSPRFAPNVYNLLYNLTQLPQATIALVDGRARGIGNEFILACDMRFATTRPGTLFANSEIGVGLVPGGGSTLYLPGLIGRGRTLEYLLAGTDVPTTQAVAEGWINQGFATADEMNGYVETLAARIALFELSAITGVKRSIDLVSLPSPAAIQGAADIYLASLANPATGRLVAAYLELDHNETRTPIELDTGRLITELYQNTTV